MTKKVSRKRFLEIAGAGSAGAVLAACAPAATPAPTAAPTSAPAPTKAPEATKAPAPTQAPTAAPAATKAPAAGGKILRIRLYGDIQNMDPAFLVSQNDNVVAEGVISGLVTYGANSYDIVNDLAESIKQVDDKTITFKLKEGIKWQKGYGEVTTEDVKYSYERIADPALKSAYKDDWAVLDKVEIVDKYNAKIMLKEPFAPLWKTTLPIYSGWVLCKKYVEEVGKEKFGTDIIGSGPYMVADWKPKQKLTLKRNPDYSGPAGVWDEIQFLPIEDDKAAEVAIEAGDVDLARIGIGSIERYKSHPTLKLVSSPALRYRWIGMNIENPKLKDINVRQAIRYAIDVPSIVQAAYRGQAEQEYGMVPPGLIGYWKDAPKYARDVAKAKGFMAKAGLTSLDLKIDCQDTTEYKSWAEIAQQNLKEIGINLSINAMDSATFWTIGEGESGLKVELFTNNYSLQPDPSWATVWFTCDQIGVWNWQRWCSKDYDDLHKKALVTLDDKQRDAMYIQMQKLYDEACHTVWITHGIVPHAYSPKIKPAITPNGIPQAHFCLPA